MAKLAILHDRITQERYFREPITGMCFRQTAAGLAWPCGDRKGCAVVLGETRSRQAVVGMERHDAHILEEQHDSDPAALLEKLEMMTEDWHIRLWATPLHDQRCRMLEDLNALRRKLRRPKLRYGDPQGWIGRGESLLPFYHALVQRRTMSEKTLFFGRSSLCADQIGKLPADAASKKVTDYPAAAALCFALAEIDLASGKAMKMYEDICGPADELGGY